MPVYNVSFLGSKKSGGTGAGLLSDQLTILENALAKDGLLSPGDYDLLIKTAQELANNGGLTPDQRSNYLVKVSGYQKDKALSAQKSDDDIKRINREVESEGRDDVMAAGNNPELFLQGREASLQAKLADLSEVIDRRDAAGDDISEHLQEYNQTLRDYQDVVGAQSALEGWKQNGQAQGSPIPGYAAYVVTNDRGEIVDVTYSKYGAKSGYVETNGMINGFQVYGKVNQKENGKNIFKLGADRFSATDAVQPDPENPGVYKLSRLIAESQQSGGKSYKQGTAGFLNISGDQLATQSYVPRNTWFKGIDGTLYQRRQDGGYSKYLNFQPEGVDPDSILVIPKAMEKSIVPYVDDTIDGSFNVNPNDPGFIGPRLPQAQLGANGVPIPTAAGPQDLGPTPQANPFGPSFNPQGGDQQFNDQPLTTSSQPVAINQNNPAPTQRSPQNPVQYAKQTVAKAGKFFKDLFS